MICTGNDVLTYGTTKRYNRLKRREEEIKRKEGKEKER